MRRAGCIQIQLGIESGSERIIRKLNKPFTLDQLRSEPGFEGMAVPDLINRLIENGHAPQVQYISGHWMDINNVQDLARASDFAHGQST